VAVSALTPGSELIIGVDPRFSSSRRAHAWVEVDGVRVDEPSADGTFARVAALRRRRGVELRNHSQEYVTGWEAFSMTIGLRRVGLTLGAVLGSLAACASMATGCGSGDDSTTNPPTDAAMGGDTTVDSAQHDGATSDATPDGTVGNDGATPDGGGVDARASDSGGDATAPVDAGDAGDTGVDSAALFAFPGQLASAICGKIGSCCFGADAAPFNEPACLQALLPGGFELSLSGYLSVLDSGLVSLDPAKAQACMNDIAAIDCTSGMITSATKLAAIKDCSSAVVGAVGPGGLCTVTPECSGEQFCNTPTDGGTVGTCTAVRGDGGSCTFGSPPSPGQSEEACSLRRSGDTGLRCNNQALTPNFGFLDAGWTCVPQFGLNADCNVDQDCASGLCDPNNFVCEQVGPLVTSLLCAEFKKDGG
jgi:hypothetical protein